MKRLEMNKLRAKIKSLAERNRLATTDEERAAVAAEMSTLRSENEQAFTEALEALIKITADDVQELHSRNIKNNQQSVRATVRVSATPINELWSKSLYIKEFRPFVVAEAGFKSTLPPSVTC